MSTAFSTFLQSVLLEAAIDQRIPSGVLDIGNDDHRMVIAEKLLDRNIDPVVVSEVVNKMTLKDGKYPDRQAFNKEGWLVTFPTPEHRAAAIKKKTHFVSDPTHGQGGMNLYYKRKGKQARQQQQDASETEPEQNDQRALSAADGEGVTDDAAAHQSNDASELPSATSLAASSKDGSQAQSSDDEPKGVESSELPAAGPAVDSQKSDSSAPSDPNNVTAQSSSPAPAPKEPDTSALVKLTREFALQQQWTDTPYGDWNDSKGQQVAVTGLDGQVVPIKFTDRESLKAFAQKKMNEGRVLHAELLRAGIL
jgi:hypothetical protein